MFMIRKLNIVKMSILPNFMCRFNIITIKISASYLVDINKLIQKFIWKRKTQNNQHNIEEQNHRTNTTQLQDYKVIV